MTFTAERDAVQNPRQLYETFLKKFFIKNTPPTNTQIELCMRFPGGKAMDAFKAHGIACFGFAGKVSPRRRGKFICFHWPTLLKLITVNATSHIEVSALTWMLRDVFYKIVPLFAEILQRKLQLAIKCHAAGGYNRNLSVFGPTDDEHVLYENTLLPNVLKSAVLRKQMKMTFETTFRPLVSKSARFSLRKLWGPGFDADDFSVLVYTPPGHARLEALPEEVHFWGLSAEKTGPLRLGTLLWELFLTRECSTVCDNVSDIPGYFEKSVGGVFLLKKEGVIVINLTDFIAFRERTSTVLKKIYSLYPTDPKADAASKALIIRKHIESEYASLIPRLDAPFHALLNSLPWKTPNGRPCLVTLDYKQLRAARFAQSNRETKLKGLDASKVGKLQVNRRSAHVTRIFGDRAWHFALMKKVILVSPDDEKRFRDNVAYYVPRQYGRLQKDKCLRPSLKEMDGRVYYPFDILLREVYNKGFSSINEDVIIEIRDFLKMGTPAFQRLVDLEKRMEKRSQKTGTGDMAGVKYSREEIQVILKYYRPWMTLEDWGRIRDVCKGRTDISIRRMAANLAHQLVQEGTTDLELLPIRKYNPGLISEVRAKLREQLSDDDKAAEQIVEMCSRLRERIRQNARE